MTVVVSYGAGTNSTAMVCEMVRLGEPIDALTFSDTGGERPETYAHLAEFSAWLVAKGYPAITTLKGSAPQMLLDGSLEGELIRLKALPSVAYGYKTCSQKWKLEPFAKWLKTQPFADVTVCIGFDADEAHRATRGDGYANGYAKRYPLIEWEWGREECVAAIARAGLAQPGKSACFFCPNSNEREVWDLHIKHPDLAARALAMEAGADLDTLLGLGRRWSWRDVIRMGEAQLPLFSTTPEMPCGCYDGEPA